MLVPLVLVGMNIAYAASAYPLGVLSDRVGRTGLLAVGVVILLLADMVLAASSSLPAIAAGVVLWGLHLGFTQGILAAMVAECAPPELRGTAFGMFNLITGLSLLVASLLAGALWEAFGPQGTFLAGAGLAALTLPALRLLTPPRKPPAEIRH